MVFSVATIGKRRLRKLDMESKKVCGKEDQKVAFYKLFSLADRLDITFMIVGTLGAIANGLAQPLITVIFGKLTNFFGTVASHVVHEISKLSLKFVYLAIGSVIATVLQMSCWMVTRERQAACIRGLYLKTLSKQGIAFFETEATTGEVIGRMSGDTFCWSLVLRVGVLVFIWMVFASRIDGSRDINTQQVGKFIQFTSTFTGGFIIAFIKGWLLSLVLCTCIPVVAIAVASWSLILTKMSSSGQVAYTQAKLA